MVYEFTYTVNGKQHIGTATDDTMAQAWKQLCTRVALKGMKRVSYKIVG